MTGSIIRAHDDSTRIGPSIDVYTRLSTELRSIMNSVVPISNSLEDGSPTFLELLSPRAIKSAKGCYAVLLKIIGHPLSWGANIIRSRLLSVASFSR